MKQLQKFCLATPREESFKDEIWGWNEYRSHFRGSGTSIFCDKRRIRQIEAKALEVKHPSRSKQLKSFLELIRGR